MIIDLLPDYQTQLFGKPITTPRYSTVSRQWVPRTQERHFQSVRLCGQSGLEKWRTTIEPDPSGVSRYVRELSLGSLDTLEGFDSHICAFANVRAVKLFTCSVLCSPSVVESLAPLRSTLVRLEIHAGPTTPSVITSLLAALPRLRHFRAHYLRILGNGDVTGLPSKVPFFEDADSLDLLLKGGASGTLDWIPPSARFRYLWIDSLSILDESGRVQQWIASSARVLKFLSIKADSPCVYLNLFSSILLSDCVISSQIAVLYHWTSRGAPPWSPYNS